MLNRKKKVKVEKKVEKKDTGNSVINKTGNIKVTEG
jgi:hypothetical protein